MGEGITSMEDVAALDGDIELSDEEMLAGGDFEVLDSDGTVTEVNSESLARMSPEHKRKIAKALMGKNNPAYKDGRRSYRDKVKAPPGSIVHHKDGDSKNNAKSNLEVIPASKRSEHEKKHKRNLNFQSSGGRKKVSRGYVARRK